MFTYCFTRVAFHVTHHVHAGHELAIFPGIYTKSKGVRAVFLWSEAGPARNAVFHIVRDGLCSEADVDTAAD